MNDGTEMAPERIDVGHTMAEEMPSFADVAQETGGAWPDGWYAAHIIEGYQAKSYTFRTEDTLSNKGDSRNLRIVLALDGGTLGRRNTFVGLNYRISDLTVANIERIKSGEADTRLRIALGKLGQLEKALGFKLERHPEGHILPTPFIGQVMDVRIKKPADSEFSEVTAFAKAGTRVKK